MRDYIIILLSNLFVVFFCGAVNMHAMSRHTWLDNVSQGPSQGPSQDLSQPVTQHTSRHTSQYTSRTGGVNNHTDQVHEATDDMDIMHDDDMGTIYDDDDLEYDVHTDQTVHMELDLAEIQHANNVRNDMNNIQSFEHLVHILYSDDHKRLASPDQVLSVLDYIYRYFTSVDIHTFSIEKLCALYHLEVVPTPGDPNRAKILGDNRTKNIQAVMHNVCKFGIRIFEMVRTLLYKTQPMNNLQFQNDTVNAKISELQRIIPEHMNCLKSMARLIHPVSEGMMAKAGATLAMYTNSMVMCQFLSPEIPSQQYFMKYISQEISKRGLRISGDKLYREVMIHKHGIEKVPGCEYDYVCAHNGCTLSYIGHINANRRNRPDHVFKPIIHTLSEDKIMNTKSWVEFNTEKYEDPFGLKVNGSSVHDFFVGVCSSRYNQYANYRFAEFTHTKAKYICDYIVRCCEPGDCPRINRYTRAWSFLNGVIYDDKFFPYPLPKELDDLCAARFIKQWHYHEYIDHMVKGAPCGRYAEGDIVPNFPRPVDARFSVYEQNLFCRHCGQSRCMHDLSCMKNKQCTQFGKAYDDAQNWFLKCTTCNKQCFPANTCTCITPSVYIKNEFSELSNIPLPFIGERCLSVQINKNLQHDCDNTFRAREYIEIYTLYMFARIFYSVGAAAVSSGATNLLGDRIPSDNNQCTIVVIGRPGTGKSTVAKILQKLCYMCTAIDNQMSEQFGKGSLITHDKKCRPAIAFEIVKNATNSKNGISRDMLCNVVSNDPVKIQVKNVQKDVEIEEWDKTLLGFGNFFFPVHDDAILRRFMRLNFLVRQDLNKSDPFFAARINMNIGCFITKMIKIYTKMTALHRSHEIWQVLPSYFLRVSEQMRSSFEPLRNYLTNPESELYGEVYTLGPRYFVKMSTFLQDYNKWRKTQGLNQQVWEGYEDIFEEFGLRESKPGEIPVDSKGIEHTGGKYIFGIGLEKEIGILPSDTDAELTGATPADDTGEIDESVHMSPDARPLYVMLKKMKDNGVHLAAEDCDAFIHMMQTMSTEY